MRTLILGGARSGKSTRAESLAAHWPASRVFVGTWRSDFGEDSEMNERVRHHQERRGRQWTTLDAGADLVTCLQGAGEHLLIDCLTVWLAGLLAEGASDLAIEARLDGLVQALSDWRGEVVIVSNEVGGGLVPADPDSRRFRDLHGRMNQRVAAVCDRVELVVAGCSLVLKEMS